MQNTRGRQVHVLSEHTFLMDLERVLVGASSVETQPTLRGLPAAESAGSKANRLYAVLAILVTHWLMASVNPAVGIQLIAQRARAPWE